MITVYTENEPKKLARVIYDFHAQNQNELSVKKGDLVIVRKTVSYNWVEVEDSASGLVVSQLANCLYSLNANESNAFFI